MNVRVWCLCLTCVLIFGAVSFSVGQGQSDDDAYLSWDSKEVDSIGKSMRINGRVGGAFDFRIVNTNRSYNYKLRATWLTPDVIRASAKLHQLRERLSDGKTRALVAEAEEAGDMFVMIEIDPREGSGVIPAEWFAFMRPKGKPEKAVAGTLMPQFRNVKALSGVMPRDYAYDVFWAVFPMITDSGEPIFSDSDREVELAVSIYNKQGQVTWKIPESIYKTLRNTP
jgi:hypothetical protein